MRILLAIDGSRSADRAVDLVAALPWSEGGSVRLVSVAPTRGERRGARTVAIAPVAAEGEDVALRTYRDAIAGAEREIRSAHSDLAIRSVLVRGRAGSVIVDQARKMEADLIVVGHRGQGRWDSILLGSVSAEVVDRAPCPVLIARGERIGPVVLADDGSPHARAAECVVTEWPIFAGLPIAVVTVTDDGFPYASAVAPQLYTETMAGYAEPLAAERRTTAEECEAAAGRLREAGFEATAHVRQGDPASQLIACASEHRAGLIVVGTRGQTGLRRLVMGSVARKVLLHAPCSVLVVREGARLDGRRIGLEREERELVSAFG
jgi:nucleotide-binding universal stress UspA family protein